MSDSFVIHGSALPESARVMGFRGHEALSRPFSFEIYLSLHRGAADALDLEDALGSRATLEVVQRPADLLAAALSKPFVFHGVVRSIELVDDAGERSVFRVTLAPELWSLSQSLHSRVFTKQSVPQILATVLGEAGVDDFELRLSGDYPAEEHVCQYKESDLDFITRWIEREGIYYFFEHEDGREKVVFADDRAVHTPLGRGPIHYHPAAEDESGRAALHTFSVKRSTAPASVRLKDYDYKNPALPIAGNAPIPGGGSSEVVLYGDRFFSPAAGQRLANLRAESIVAEREVASASGSVHHLRSGFTFELEAHPRATLNQAWLVTELTHIGRGIAGAKELDALIEDGSREVYRVKLKAIPAETQYRSTRSTAWPRIHAFENAVVDGPENSQYAQIDDQGRYLVRFRFDESALNGGKASTYVRMAQPHGGSVEGFHFPLRKGTEVLVTFLGGDPDRPVIAGVLPNAATPSPIAQANATKNILQTGGSSRLEIEDQAGGQYMKQFTPVANTMLWMGTDATSPQGHNVELSTDGSGFQSFGTYLDQFVGGDKSEHVVGNVSRAYDKTYSTILVGDVTETYLSNQTTTVTGDVTRSIEGKLTETIGGAVNQTYSSTLGIDVTKAVKQQYGADHGLTVGGEQKLSVTGATTHQFDTGLSVTVNAAVSTHTANAGYELKVKPSATMNAAEKFDIRAESTATLSSKATTVFGDQSVVVNAGATITIGPKNILINGTEIITFSGPSLIEILGGDITVSGGNLAIAAGASLQQSAAGALTIAGAGAQIDGGPVVDVHGGVIKLNS